jgi:hypothetical protein
MESPIILREKAGVKLINYLEASESLKIRIKNLISKINKFTKTP